MDCGIEIIVEGLEKSLEKLSSHPNFKKANLEYYETSISSLKGLIGKDNTSKSSVLKKPAVKTQEWITRQDLRDNPNTQYIFGDNLDKKGYGGQAKEMRGEPNAIGIPTKKKPSKKDNAYFTDEEFEANVKAIDMAINKIDTTKDMILPEKGIGTDLADTANKAPKTWNYLAEKMNEIAGFEWLEPVEVTVETDNELKAQNKNKKTTDIKYQISSEENNREFDQELNKKLVKILKKLYPEINLEYTTKQIQHAKGLMNQEVVDNNIKLALKLVDGLSKLGKNRATIRLNTKDKPNIETNITKALQGKGVPLNQIELMFEYMRQKDISSIKTNDLAERITMDLGQVVELNTTTRTEEGKTTVATDYYKDLSVPGGKNYKEVEISTPDIVAPKKGHAEFATDKGIGWYRVDDVISKIDFNSKEPQSPNEQKTLRVLEMQSDMFQKMKDRKLDFNKPDFSKTEFRLNKVKYAIKYNFNFKTEKHTIISYSKTIKGRGTENISKKEYDKAAMDKYGKPITEVINGSKQLDKTFLQLLNTDNKWVKFFIQSIVQDSQKKGYEKIRFPAGETAVKVEGHESIAEQLKDAQNKVTNLEEDAKESYRILKNRAYASKEDIKWFNENIPTFEKYISYTVANESTQGAPNEHALVNARNEVKELKTEGLEKLAPIEGFYQIRVKNTLEKMYDKDKVKTITDEYGNKWFELYLDPKRDNKTIMFQRENTWEIKGQADIEAKTVLINSLLQSQDTLPHEYAHHYIAMFRDAPIVQEAIDKYSHKFDVLLPIGTSGSGKSTFIKSLPQKNLVVIEPDKMRVEFTGDMNDKLRDSEIYVEAANRAIKAIKEGKQVIFDTTNLTKEKRFPFIDAIKSQMPEANIQYKLMPLNPELAKKRIKKQLANGEDRANVPDKTIDRHAQSYNKMLEDIKNEPITNYDNKSAIGEEALVQAIGEQVVKQKGEVYNWWKKFSNWVKSLFNKLSELEKEEIKNILTDAFLNREDLRAEEKKNSIIEIKVDSKIPPIC